MESYKASLVLRRHLEALRSAFKVFEVAKLRGIPEHEVDSWRQALHIFYERQVAQRRNSEPEVQQSKEDRVANELYRVCSPAFYNVIFLMNLIIDLCSLGILSFMALMIVPSWPKPRAAGT
eukprot:symbB.v1.2.035171.t1/scaffold4675.1/size36618/2